NTSWSVVMGTSEIDQERTSGATPDRNTAPPAEVRLERLRLCWRLRRGLGPLRTMGAFAAERSDDRFSRRTPGIRTSSRVTQHPVKRIHPADAAEVSPAPTRSRTFHQTFHLSCVSL